MNIHHVRLIVIKERLPNVYGEENLRMDGIADKVKGALIFGGYMCGKWGIATFWGKSVMRGKSRPSPLLAFS